MKASTIDLERLLRRLHLPTVRRLYAELETRAEKEEMSYRDYLAILIAEEVAHRGETRVRRSVHQAHFPFLATIEEFDFTFQSTVRLSLIGSALGPELISEGRTMVLCGPSGTGKTHLAIAIAYKAIQNGGTALFREANHLIEELSEATRRGTLRQAIEPYIHADVLVIDELGYLTYPQDAANVLFQVVNQRYLQKKAIVVTTNKPLDKWAGVLHDKDLAEAIIDRVLARGRLIELRGTSYRTRHLKNTKDDGAQPLEQGAIVSGISGPEFPEPTTELSTPSLGECAGRLTVQPVDARGNRVNLRGSQATVHATWQGQDAYLLLELGESTLVPAGLLRIAPSSSLPTAAFVATSREVGAADEVVAEVVVGDLWQVRVIPRLPEGRAPSRWGLRLGGDRRESLGMAEESFAFWTGSESMDLVVFCQGREPVRARLERAANVRRDAPVDFIALLGPAVPGR